MKLTPNQARKRNFAKFRLAGMYSSLRGICTEAHYYLNSPLLDEERVALISIFKDLKVVLKHWDENYIELKKIEKWREITTSKGERKE